MIGWLFDYNNSVLLMRLATIFVPISKFLFVLLLQYWLLQDNKGFFVTV